MFMQLLEVFSKPMSMTLLVRWTASQLLRMPEPPRGGIFGPAGLSSFVSADKIVPRTLLLQDVSHEKPFSVMPVCGISSRFCLFEYNTIKETWEPPRMLAKTERIIAWEAETLDEHEVRPNEKNRLFLVDSVLDLRDKKWRECNSQNVRDFFS